MLILLCAVDAVNLYDVVRRTPHRSAPSFFEVPASNGTLVQVPKLIYATAHKRHRTAELVKKAFAAGFRGVDTAHGERKRYNESAVGEALVDGVFLCINQILPARHHRAGVAVVGLTPLDSVITACARLTV